MIRLRIWALVLALLVPLAARAQQPAGDDRAAQANQHYQSGMAHFHLEEWDAAIEEWQAGFRIKPVPEFLYNIAQAYRLSKRWEKSLSFYQKYLRMAPNAPNRAEVERHIATLNKLIAEQGTAGSSPPTGPIEPETGRSTASATRPAPAAPPPEPKPSPVVSAPPPATTATPAATPSAEVTAHAPEKSITKKGWFWGVMGGVAAVVVAGVIVGVVLGTNSDSTKTLPLVRF
jgi:iron complex outermembrane receptor protein